MQARLSKIEPPSPIRMFPCWDAKHQFLYKVWKEAWDNGYYRGGGEPFKPSDLDRTTVQHWEDHARKIYRKVTSKPEKWEQYRQEYSQRSKHDPACIAAERAMAGHSAQSSSEVGRSDSSARKRRDEDANSQHSTRTSNLLRSRQYKPGQGLANKTLRASTPTRIPVPLHRHGHNEDIDAPRHASLYPDSASVETYGALPSSYRRLRKARSMFVPRGNGAISQQSSWPTPRARNRSLRSVTSSAVLQTNNLRVRLKRSLPFLRPKSTNTRRPCADYEWGMREEAVQMARAQFLDDMELQRIQEIQSTQRQRRPKRADRSEDVATTAAKTPTPLVPPPMPADLPTGPQPCLRKRSFSASFRSHFRKILGKSVSSKRAIPPQQLDRRDYYFPDLGIDVGRSSAFDSYLIPDISRTIQARACGPSEVEQELLEDLDQVPGTLPPTASRESLHSAGRSRVTSWTDSSVAGSISLRSGPIDRNRLSVIKEDGGPHQPSSSAGRHIGGVEVFREPLQTVSDDGQLLPPVDSHRVYSALIKRISQEEAEMETTRIALENINSNNGSRASMERPTIRTVCSESSLAIRVTTPPDEQRRKVSTASYTWHRTDNEMGVPEENFDAENRKERLAMEELQSTFFPFSSEQKPTAPSPFKRLLTERRRQKTGRTSIRNSERNSEDAGSVIVNAKAGNSNLGRPRFGFSSESIYSRTTNGGINEQYAPPIASSDDLGNVHRRDAGDPGTTSAASRGHMRTSSDNSPEINPSSSVPQNSKWNPWSETLTAMTAGAERQDPSHVRGQTQDGLENDSNEAQQSCTTITFRTPTQGFRAITSSSTPSPVTTISVRKRRKEVQKTSSCGVLNSISNKTGDEVKIDVGLRKFSPGRVRKILQEKKSQLSVLQDNNNKENIPTDEGKSILNSSAEKSHKAYGARNTSARLRQRASRMTMRSYKELHSTPQSEKKSISSTPDRFEDSPGERAKNQLVARLSRPFNMDVPPHNRPFDSTYLGKRTPGHPDPMGNSRLSVARPIPESIGGSPSRNTSGPEGDEPTVAQLAESAVGRGTSKVLGLFGSRRMVSSFLKSRKVSKSTSEDDLSAVEGSPAFI